MAVRAYDSSNICTQLTHLGSVDRTWGVFACACGALKKLREKDVRHGKTRSCGCLRRRLVGENSRTHGRTKSPTWWSWIAMRKRCLEPKNSHWKHYGGRGIAVCDRWSSFDTFVSDMGERPLGTTLDRIDGDGNYTSPNCRWATPSEQLTNSWKSARRAGNTSRGRRRE